VFDALSPTEVRLDGPWSVQDAYWPWRALAACLLGLWLALPFLLRFAHLERRARVSFCGRSHRGGLRAGDARRAPAGRLPETADIVVWLALMPAVTLTGAILVAQAFEFVELYWPAGCGGWRCPGRPGPMGNCPA
jgi:hypothetical protein